MTEDQLRDWVNERLDQHIRKLADASSPEGYVFNVDRSMGNDEWLLSARLKHGMSGKPKRTFVIQIYEVK